MSDKTDMGGAAQYSRDSSRDRPASLPGGCECEQCGCIFIGEEWHSLCAICNRIERTKRTGGNS